MKHPQKETAAPAGTGHGGKDIQAPSHYVPEAFPAREIAARRIAGRMGLSLPVARVVCELSGLGGAHA